SEPTLRSAAGSVPTKSWRSTSTVPVPVVVTVTWRFTPNVPPAPVGWFWLRTVNGTSPTAAGGGGGGADDDGGGPALLDDGGGALVVVVGGGGLVCGGGSGCPIVGSDVGPLRCEVDGEVPGWVVDVAFGVVVGVGA